MTSDSVVEILRQALMAAFWLGAPLLLVGFAAGVLLSLLQIVTSIQDTAVNTVPRLAVFLGALVVLLPWMLMRLMAYTTSIFGNLGKYAQ